MKARTKPSTRAPKLARLAAASATIILSYTSCGGLGGITKRGDSDDTAPQIGDEEPKKKRGSLFERAKRRNSWIDEDIQTTRRERIAAQNNTNFGTTPPSPPVPALPVSSDPLTPNSELDPDPDPAPKSTPTPKPTIAAPAARPKPAETLKLPPLDSNLPQAERPAGERISDPLAPKVDSEGYTPLQPRLPDEENIEPPSD